MQVQNYQSFCQLIRLYLIPEPTPKVILDINTIHTTAADVTTRI